jgi:hypothetical protein
MVRPKYGDLVVDHALPFHFSQLRILVFFLDVLLDDKTHTHSLLLLQDMVRTALLPRRVFVQPACLF